MESHETPAVEATSTEASNAFLSRLNRGIAESPVLQPWFKVLSNKKATAAISVLAGLGAAAQATEGGTSGIVGATMLGILAAETAGVTVINTIRERRNKTQQSK